MTQIPPRGTPEFEEYKKQVEEAAKRGARIECALKEKEDWEYTGFPAWTWWNTDYRISSLQYQPQFFQNQAPEPSITPTEQRIVKALDQIVYGLAQVYSISTYVLDPQDRRVVSLHDYTDRASQLVTALVADLPLPSPSEAPSEATAPQADAGKGGSDEGFNADPLRYEWNERERQFVRKEDNSPFSVGDRVRHRNTGWAGEIRFICPNGMARVLSDEGLVKDYPVTSLINLTRKASIEAAGKAVDKVLDPNVEAVREMLLQRSRVGLKKYGVTTDRDDLSELDWHRHHLEELLDAAVYVMRKIRNMEGAK